MAKGFIGKGLRVAAIGAAVVLLLLLGLRLAVPVAGVRIADSQLSRLLGTGVRIGKIDLALLRGALALRDVRVRQPEGFGEGDLLLVPEVRARVKLGSLLHFPIRIQEVTLESPRFRIVRNRARELDLSALLSAFSSPTEEENGEKATEPRAEEGPPNYPVVIEEAGIRNLSLSYTDYSHEERPYEAGLENLTFVVTHLSLESSSGKDRPGKGAGTARGSLTVRNLRIDQPPGFTGDPLLEIPEVSLKARVPSVFEPHLTLEELSLRDASIRLARNRSGRLNLEALLSESLPQVPKAPEAEEEVSSDKEEAEAPGDWRILLKRFGIERLSFLYTDDSSQNEPLTMTARELSLDVTDLLLASEEGLASDPKGSAPGGDSEKEAPGARGSLVVRDVHVDQPSGFSGDTFLAWPELKADFSIDSAFAPSITIEEAKLLEPRIHLAFDKAGQWNVDVLLSKAIPRSRGESERAKKAPSAPPASPKARIRLNRFSIHGLGLSFTDSSYDTKPLEERLEDVELEAANLAYDPPGAREKTLPGTVTVTGRRVQKPFEDAPLGLYAKMGLFGDAIPAVNGSLQVGGFELAPLSHTLPPGTSQAIGGDAMDLSVDLALAADVLDCNAKVKSIGGSSLALRIGGTPEQPELDTSNMLFLVFFRSGGALGSVAGKLGGAGMGVAGTAVGTVKVVGTGAVKTVGSVGGGLLKTTKGLATADVGGIAEGLKKTTVGTVKEGAGTALGTLGEVKEGAVDVGSAGIGKQQAEAWRKAVEVRWEKAWKEAQTRVDRMPYPDRSQAPDSNKALGSPGSGGGAVKPET